MTKDNFQGQQDDEHGKRLKSPLHQRLLTKLFIPVIVLVIGVAVAGYIKNTGPKASRKQPLGKAVLVEAVQVHPTSEPVTIKALGSVVPAREIALKSRVSGEIVKVDPAFIAGGIINEGSEILRIDLLDYELALVKAKVQVAKADSELQIEMGRQEVAKREWGLLNGRERPAAHDSGLALRKPQLARVKAELDAAKADLDQAGINLERTVVRAPFNAVVRSKNVDVGSHISTQDTLATLAGADEYRIQVSVPVDRLKWISFPDNRGKGGSRVDIRYGNSNSAASKRHGKVIKLLSDLEKEGRMARILVSVKDPLDLKSGKTGRLPLLIDSVVHVEIEGIRLAGILKIPRTALREGSKIWLADRSGKLIVRNAGILWRDAETVLLKEGLKEGELLVLSDIPAPVEGMKLRLNGAPEKTAPGEKHN